MSFVNGGDYVWYKTRYRSGHPSALSRPTLKTGTGNRRHAATFEVRNSAPKEWHFRPGIIGGVPEQPLRHSEVYTP